MSSEQIKAGNSQMIKNNQNEERSSNMKKGIITALAIGVIALAVGIETNAFAGRGMGQGYHGGGQGRHDGNYGGRGYGGNWENLTEEQRRQLEDARQSFWDDTRELRQKMQEAKLDLERELIKTEPDSAKASELQKALSDLENQFEQKRLTHIISVKKINPDAGMGFSRGKGRHHGRSMGDGMGRGMGRGRGYGRGDCPRW